jgi:hypothetical protein
MGSGHACLTILPNPDLLYEQVRMVYNASITEIRHSSHLPPEWKSVSPLFDTSSDTLPLFFHFTAAGSEILLDVW